MLDQIKSYHYEGTPDVQLANKINTDDAAPGFIHHPNNIPFHVKHVSRLPVMKQNEIESGKSTLGLCFFSDKYLKPGTLVELTIPLRGEDHKFIGQVVLIRETHRGYEAGIWLRSQTDAFRARIIEQICYIDGYLEEKQDHSASPINKELGIQEWISRNAAHFPA